MGDFTFRISPNIILGSYTASRLGQFAEEYGSRYMVIVDPLLKEVNLIDKILQPLTEHQVNYFVFDDIANVANSKTLEQALKLAREGHIQGIIVAGGAKALNVARAVSALFAEKQNLYNYFDDTPITAEPLPLICLPTTLRDMFVFTDKVSIIDSRNQHIKLLKVANNLTKLVVFDSALSVTLSENQTASISLDILCIALEAYLSQKATFFSDMIIEKTLELLSYALDGSPTLSVTTPSEELLCQSGLMASLGSATSSLGAASLLSLCINARFSISRALVSGILLPHIIEDGATFKVDRIAKVARIMRIGTAEMSDTECAEKFASDIRQRLAKAQLPSRLKDLNISIEQLSLAAEEAGRLELINSVQRSMSSDDLFDMVKKAF